MINQENFAKRLKKVMLYYNETAASFSEKIGVQRSSISHILSGRNKPSLEFIMKILSSYDEVDLYWLLNGKGNFPKTENITNSPKEITEEQNQIKTISKTYPSKDIERIVIFYKDGSFKNFQN
ncbi:MAG: helix-turn-helix transcriptional regulator [Flavobacteriaceae bacterium]